MGGIATSQGRPTDVLGLCEKANTSGFV